MIDPFAGSNTTGEACEELARNWIAIEHNVGVPGRQAAFALSRMKRPTKTLPKIPSRRHPVAGRVSGIVP